MGPKQLDFNPQTETVVAVTDVKYWALLLPYVSRFNMNEE